MSVLIDGERHAAVLDGDRVGIDDRVGGLDAVLTAGDIVRAKQWLPLAAVAVDAPLRPPVVFCVGQNYADHLAEKQPVHRPEPEFFLKAGQTIAAPDDPAVLDDRVTGKLDYETELGIVIGRPGRAIPAESALDHVFGYLIANDLTARDRQVVLHPDGTHGMALGPGKNFDGATRFGAAVLTADEAGDPAGWDLHTWVGGELRQRNNTANLISSLPEIIAFVSTLLTLHAGTVILTGTPGGTAWGSDLELGGTGRTPDGLARSGYLQAGQVVRGEIGPELQYEFRVTGRSDAP